MAKRGNKGGKNMPKGGGSGGRMDPKGGKNDMMPKGMDKGGKGRKY